MKTAELGTRIPRNIHEQFLGISPEESKQQHDMRTHFMGMFAEEFRLTCDMKTQFIGKLTEEIC